MQEVMDYGSGSRSAYGGAEAERFEIRIHGGRNRTNKTSMGDRGGHGHGHRGPQSSQDGWHGSTWQPEEPKGPTTTTADAWQQQQMTQQMTQQMAQQQQQQQYVDRHAKHRRPRGRTKLGDRAPYTTAYTTDPPDRFHSSWRADGAAGSRAESRDASRAGVLSQLSFADGDGGSTVVLEDDPGDWAPQRGRQRCAYQDGSYNFGESCSIVTPGDEAFKDESCSIGRRSASTSPGRGLSPLQNNPRYTGATKSLAADPHRPEREHAVFPSRWKTLPEAATPVKHADHLGFRGPIRTSTEAAVHYPGFAPSEVQRAHMPDSLNLFTGVTGCTTSVSKGQHPGFFPDPDLRYATMARKPSIEGLVSPSNERHFALSSRLDNGWELASEQSNSRPDQGFVTELAPMVTTHQSTFGTNPEFVGTGRPVVRMGRHDGGQMYPISSQVAAESLPVRREPGWRGSTRRNDCGQPFASSRESERPGRQGGASPARLGAGPGAESGAETVARDNAGASQQTVSWADGGLLLRTQTWPLDTSTEQTFLED